MNRQPGYMQCINGSYGWPSCSNRSLAGSSPCREDNRFSIRTSATREGCPGWRSSIPLLRMDAAGRSHQTATLSYHIVKVNILYASIASRLRPETTGSICFRDGVVELSMACTEARWHFCNDLSATQPRKQLIKMLAEFASSVLRRGNAF